MTSTIINASRDAARKMIGHDIERLVAENIEDLGGPTRYIEICMFLSGNLDRQIGVFPEDTLRKSILDTGKIVTKLDISPRTIIVQLFAKTLRKYSDDLCRVEELAKLLEKTCYANVISLSISGDTPLLRSWTNVKFMDLYSTRCGVVQNLIDMDSENFTSYGNNLLEKLFSGELTASDLCNKPVKELCPQYCEAEATEIARRREQKITLKVSTLFKCPFCKQNQCTYQEVQRRSLDEAPDYICQCLNPQCGRKFTGHT